MKKKLIVISRKDRRLTGCPHCSCAAYDVLTTNSIDSTVMCPECGGKYIIEKEVEK
ncbi:hypothetical protein HN670_03340 [bacterium]|nr:hypothetical protein [bacterium]